MVRTERPERLLLRVLALVVDDEAAGSRAPKLPATRQVAFHVKVKQTTDAKQAAAKCKQLYARSMSVTLCQSRCRWGRRSRHRQRAP